MQRNPRFYVCLTALVFLASGCSFLKLHRTITIPHYPLSQLSREELTNSRSVLSFTTSDSFEDIMSYYDKILLAEGWNKVETKRYTDPASLGIVIVHEISYTRFGSGDDLDLLIKITQKDKKNDVTINKQVYDPHNPRLD